MKDGLQLPNRWQGRIRYPWMGNYQDHPKE